MTMISDLPQDLLEEILSRVPITCRRKVRSTCKRWNVLFSDQSFIMKHCGKVAKELLVVLRTSDFRICLMNVNLYNPKDFVESSIKVIGKLSSQVEISQVFHCNGLLLFVTWDNTRRLVVCNPYLGQVRLLIHPINKVNRFYKYAIGCDNNNNCKIFRYGYELDCIYFRVVEYEIYDFKSDSWKVLRGIPDRYILFYHCEGRSLQGNTYLVARDSKEGEPFVSCFDFTRERFGPHLHLPYHHSSSMNCIRLDTTREEQLAVLFKRKATNELEVWITTKIDPDTVSWITFLKVDIEFTGDFWFADVTFLVDEKNKAAVICYNQKAYVFGEDGNYEILDLGKSETWTIGRSYVPSPVFRVWCRSSRYLK